MKPQNLVNLSELEEKINLLKSASIISITTLTEPVMRKTGNPYVGKIKKMQTLNCVINFDYENTVNNRLEKEEKGKDFVAKENWGQRTENSKAIIENKGEKYLQVTPTNPSNPIYFFNGNEIEVSVIKPFLPEVQAPVHQNLSDKKQVHIRRFKLENIVKVCIGGEELFVK